MNILLTYDYELFFGTKTGTVENCLLRPTELLRDIAHRTGIKLVFFIDTGYLRKLEDFKQNDAVRKEYDDVKKQISELASAGHDCQLHIHPHWEDCTHDGVKWIMTTDRYKLDDFSDREIYRIVGEYKSLLESWTGTKVHTYRAGGWCLQPFSRVCKAFTDFGLRTDSTVFYRGKFTSGNYFYDFTNAPDLSSWNFSDDLCKPDTEGPFHEIPISSYYYSPFFFWNLFVRGKLNKKIHRSMGDGIPMSSPGLKRRMLTSGMQLSGCTDGYFATKLDEITERNQNRGFAETVFLGHPKACSRFSLAKLEKFITTNKAKHRFVTFTDLSR